MDKDLKLHEDEELDKLEEEEARLKLENIMA